MIYSILKIIKGFIIDLPQEFVKQVKDAILKKESLEGEIQHTTEDGIECWFQDSVMPIYDDNNQKVGEVVVRYDITQKKQYEEMAITDPLTQLYNRRYFNDVTEREISRAKREKSVLAFVILDVDYFKKYNDTYGHIAGDEALVAVARSLKDSLHRGSDYAFRLGGEEFGMLYTSENEEKASQFAEHIRKNIEDLNIPHTSSEVTDHVTASLGLAVIDFSQYGTADKDELYRTADSALYSAKENGRNQVYLHINDEMELF